MWLYIFFSFHKKRVFTTDSFNIIFIFLYKSVTSSYSKSYHQKTFLGGLNLLISAIQHVQGTDVVSGGISSQKQPTKSKKCLTLYLKGGGGRMCPFFFSKCSIHIPKIIKQRMELKICEFKINYIT